MQGWEEAANNAQTTAGLVSEDRRAGLLTALRGQAWLGFLNLQWAMGQHWPASQQVEICKMESLKRVRSKSEVCPYDHTSSPLLWDLGPSCRSIS